MPEVYQRFHVPSSGFCSTFEIEKNPDATTRFVQLNKEFSLLHVVGKNKIPYKRTSPRLNFADILLLGLSRPLCFDVGLSELSSDSLTFVRFTPFNPELGCYIKNNSLVFGSEEDEADLLSEASLSKASICLDVYASFASDSQELTNSFKKELSKLRLQVMFPDLRGMFESSPKFDEDFIEQDEIPHGLIQKLNFVLFEEFYPLEGDLPRIPHPYETGLPICLPDDLEKLAQIRAKFVMHPLYPSV